MDLNDDAINLILKNLCIKDVINVSLVSTKFNDLLKANILWKYFYEKTYTEVIYADLSYRSQYRKCHSISLLIKVLDMNISINDIVKLSNIVLIGKRITSIPPKSVNLIIYNGYI